MAPGPPGEIEPGPSYLNQCTKPVHSLEIGVVTPHLLGSDGTAGKALHQVHLPQVLIHLFLHITVLFFAKAFSHTLPHSVGGTQ